MELQVKTPNEQIYDRHGVQNLEAIPDPPPSKPQPGIDVTCDICSKATLGDPFFMAKGLAEIEKFKFLQDLADRIGWQYKITKKANNELEADEISFICPACAGGTFNDKTTCPKCGGKKVDTIFCSQKQCVLGIQRPHLHRICQKCKYVFAENCLDQK
jgi:hypothetical protein